jgi:O-antigen ligase
MNRVAFVSCLLLVCAAPLIRGGNRFIALIPLEWLAILVLLALAPAAFELTRRSARQLFGVAALAAALAVLQLAPLPANVWAALPGHEQYVGALAATGADSHAWRALSLSPDATAASLLALLPLLASFVAAALCSLDQLRWLLRVVCVTGALQVVVGLLQLSSSDLSFWYFGQMSYGTPIGTFANRNLFANYVAMTLACYVWLWYDAWRTAARNYGHRTRTGPNSWQRSALWAAGALVLVVGVLMARSRGGALFGLSMVIVAALAVGVRVQGFTRGWRVALAAAVLLVAAAVTLIGVDVVGSRFTTEQVSSSANFRADLARSTLHGALAFLPFGSGWGTYAMVYPRFQPPSITGFANHAHNDYFELLFEGGLLFVIPAVAFAWLCMRRAWKLLRAARRGTSLDREAMAAVICGLGLLGLLLHACIDFPLRIPANAMLGALLAGVYLRPLGGPRQTRDSVLSSI